MPQLLPFHEAPRVTSAVERISRRFGARQMMRAIPHLRRASTKVGQLMTVPAYKGMAVELRKGQKIKVINTHGHQVCDFWAFATHSQGPGGLLRVAMSMHHSHDAIRKHIPMPGDTLVTS